MNSDSDDIGAYVDAAARLMALHLTPEHRAGVIRQFTTVAAMADKVMGFALPPEEEPAALLRHD